MLAAERGHEVGGRQPVIQGEPTAHEGAALGLRPRGWVAGWGGGCIASPGDAGFASFSFNKRRRVRNKENWKLVSFFLELGSDQKGTKSSPTCCLDRRNRGSPHTGVRPAPPSGDSVRDSPRAEAPGAKLTPSLVPPQSRLMSSRGLRAAGHTLDVSACDIRPRLDTPHLSPATEDQSPHPAHPAASSWDPQLQQKSSSPWAAAAPTGTPLLRPSHTACGAARAERERPRDAVLVPGRPGSHSSAKRVGGLPSGHRMFVPVGTPSP